jgi:hypothetical protein
LSIDPAGFATICKAILHAPPVVAAVAAKAEEMCATANGMAVEAGAVYAVTVVADWPDSSRARANVWTSNYAARKDEAAHATLLKTLAQSGGSAG